MAARAEISHLICRACGETSPAGKRFCGDCGTRLPTLCPHCQSIQDSSNRFCDDCGSPLQAWCAACGSAVTPNTPFCGACGAAAGPGVSLPGERRPAAPLSTRDETAREERRLVTALFCDLVGFTPLTERLDAEGVRAIQTTYFERMSGEIARFGGVVEKFAGDAILALFGVPLAQGDDAERAVLCALAMQSALIPLRREVRRDFGVELAIRVGVNTGEAVSGMLDAGGRKDYSITGDVINTAARLQTAAEPGGIMVGLDTMRLTRRSVVFGERHDLTLKGKAQAVGSYAVLGTVETQGQEAGARHPVALVGREHELGALQRAWERAQTGDGQLVALMAEAGFGKSRLLADAAQRFASDRVFWVRCSSHGGSISLGTVAELLRAVLAVRDGEDPAVLRLHLTAILDDLLAPADDETRSTAADVLGEVLGLADIRSSVTDAGPQARRQTLVKRMRLLFMGLAQRAPSVLILEDAHGMDSASAEVLAEVLCDVVGLPLLVLAAYRPPWTPPWDAWAWVEKIVLRPLTQPETIALAESVLGGAALAPDLERYVIDRSGGNPFFVEELLNTLQDEGGIAYENGRAVLVAATAAHLPSTLTEIVLARLDRLPGTLRSLVQTASVIGRTFSADLLTAVMGTAEHITREHLTALTRSEIVVLPPGSESDYAFKHVTMRDVAYSTLLAARRRELHESIADAMIALHLAEDAVETVAYHLAQTDRHADAALWLERAGDRAAEVYANESAVDHYETARTRLGQAGGDAASAARLAAKLGGIFRIIAWYDEALEELETAARLYRDLGDVDSEAQVAAQIGDVHFLRGAPEDAVTRLQSMLARFDEDADDADLPHGLIDVYMALVDPLYHLNRFEDALTASYRAVELARPHDSDRLVVQATVRYGLALGGIGRLDEAGRVLGDVIPQAEAGGDGAVFMQALLWRGDIDLAQGRPGGAQAMFARALEVARSRGDRAGEAEAVRRLGQAAFVLGDWPAAQSHWEQAVDLVRSMSYSHFSAWTLMTLGEHYLRLGDSERASRYLEEPFVIAERSGRVGLLPYLQIPLAAWDLWDGEPERALDRLNPLLQTPVFETTLDHRAMQIVAEADLAAGNRAAAAEIAGRGLDQATGQANEMARLGWLSVAAAIAVESGDRDAAHRLLDEALALAERIPHPYEQAGIYLRRSALDPSSPERRRDLEAALTIFERLGAQPHTKRVRGALDNRAAV